VLDLKATRAQIHQAGTEEAVFLIVQKYLESMDEQAFEGLPDELRPHLIRSADDVSSWALYFNRQDLTIPPGEGPRTVLRDMLLLFTTAAHRLAQIGILRVQRLKS
jgi:hypothetical protein